MTDSPLSFYSWFFVAVVVVTVLVLVLRIKLIWRWKLVIEDLVAHFRGAFAPADTDAAIDALYSMAMMIVTVAGPIRAAETAALEDILYALTGVAQDESELRSSISRQKQRAAAQTFAAHARAYLQHIGRDRAAIAQAFEMLVFAASCRGSISGVQRAMLEQARGAFALPPDSIEEALASLAASRPGAEATSSVWSYDAESQEVQAAHSEGAAARQQRREQVPSKTSRHSEQQTPRSPGALEFEREGVSVPTGGFERVRPDRKT